MSDKEQNKINDSRDELLKSALSVNLSEELPTKEEEQQRHAFSVDFAIRIKDLIGDADKIIAENAAAAGTEKALGQGDAKPGETEQEEIKQEAASEASEQEKPATAVKTEKSVENAGADRPAENTGLNTDENAEGREKPAAEAALHITEEKSKAEEQKTAAAGTISTAKTGRGRSRAEAAQERMTGQVIPASFLRRHRKAIVNAASVVLVFGIGVFFLKEGGALLGGGSEANKAAVQSEQETPAASEEAAGSVQEQQNALTETAAADSSDSQPAAGSTEENDLPEAASDRTADRSVSGAGGQTGTTGRTAETQAVAAEQRTQSETKERSQSTGEAQNRVEESSRSGKTQNRPEEGSRTTQSRTRNQSGQTQSSRRNTGSGASGSAGGAAAETQRSQAKNSGKAANETGATPRGTASGTASNRDTAAGSAPRETVAGTVSGETAAGSAANEAAAGNDRGQQSSAVNGTNAVGGVQLPNPIRKLSGPEEFAKQLGFSLSVYPAAAERTDTEYSLISNKTAQIHYYSETIDSKMVFRAEKKETLLAELPEQERKPGEAELGEDVWRTLSGIYYPFDESRTEFWTVKGENGEPDIPITVRIVESEESSGALATWEKDGVLYTLWAEDASRHRNAVGKEAKNLIELADVQSPSA